MFALPDSFSAVPRTSSPVFMFFALGHVFGGTVGIRSLFHVLRSQTRFRRYRGRQVPFLCFALPNLFSAVLRASCPIFMFCASGLIFGGTEGIGSRLHIFLLPDSFSAVPWASVPVFSGTEGVESSFHGLRFRTRFCRYRVRRVSFSSFGCPDSFSTVPKASGPVFMFCTTGLVFGGTEGVLSRFYVFRSRTHFWRYRGRPIPFSYFPLPDMFLTVPKTSDPFFTFCASGIVLRTSTHRFQCRRNTTIR
jgi:hypothetical protein